MNIKGLTTSYKILGKNKGFLPNAIKGHKVDFTSDVTAGDFPLTVNFTDRTVGYSGVYLWEFGDGDTSSSENPSHVYEQPGTYNVTLTVAGNPKEKQNYISVSTPLIPVDHTLRLIATAPYLTIENTNRISVWNDVDSRWSFTQGDNAKRPFWDASNQTPNGKNAGFWNGGKRLNMAAYAANRFIDKNVGQTIIFVGGDLTSDDDHIFSKYEASSNNRQFFFKTDAYTVQTTKGSFDSDEQALFTRQSGWNVYMCRWEPGVECSVYINGSATPLASAASPASTITDVTEATKLCTDGDGDFGLNEGEGVEFATYKRPLTDQEWANWYSNMRRDWLI